MRVYPEVVIGEETIPNKNTYQAQYYYPEKSGVIRSKKTGNVVGFFTANVRGPNIWLEQFDIFPEFQRLGYGTAFIRSLFLENPEVTTISGQSEEDAVPFYIELSASFYETCLDCPVLTCPYNKSCDRPDTDFDAKTCDEYSDCMFDLNRDDFFNAFSIKIRTGDPFEG